MSCPALRLFVATLLASFVAAGPLRAEDAPPAALPPPAIPDSMALTLPEGATPQSLSYGDCHSPTFLPYDKRPNPNCDPYRPSVPIGETRSTWTTLVLPPAALSLTSAEAQTPRSGQVRVALTRISDDRLLEDDNGVLWETDGELQVFTVEYVSPGKTFGLFGSSARIHGTASVHMYSLEFGVFDSIRNWVEENLLGAGDRVGAEHDIGGRTLTIDDDDVLGGNDTMFKVRLGGKLALPSAQLGRGSFHHALSFGVTAPAFGDKTDSGNRDWQPDATLAYAWDLSRKVRLTGATTVAVPGTSNRFAALGVGTEDVIVSSMLNVEWWPNPCWGFSLGITGNTPYTKDTELPMDLASIYMNIGIQYRPNVRHSLFLVFTENLDQDVQTFNTSPGNTDFSNAQKESDFSFILGWRYSL